MVTRTANMVDKKPKESSVMLELGKRLQFLARYVTKNYADVLDDLLR